MSNIEVINEVNETTNLENHSCYPYCKDICTTYLVNLSGYYNETTAEINCKCECYDPRDHAE